MRLPSSEERADRINEGLSKEKKELSVENGLGFREGRGREGEKGRKREVLLKCMSSFNPVASLQGFMQSCPLPGVIAAYLPL